MTDNSCCGLCGAHDSWRHSLINCTVARCTWALVDDELAQRLVTTTESSAKQWLFTLMESLPRNQFVFLSVTLWAIWSARRKAIHEGIFQTPQATHSFIKRFIDELVMCKENQPAAMPRASPAGPVRRAPRAPPLGFAKIHVDAGVRQGRGGSAAAVCRDREENYLGSSVLVIPGVDDPATLEVIACQEALALAEDLHLKSFVVAYDSKQVISDINKGGRGRYGAIISEIHLQAKHFQCVIFLKKKFNVSLILSVGRLM